MKKGIIILLLILSIVVIVPLTMHEPPLLGAPANTELPKDSLSINTQEILENDTLFQENQEILTDLKEMESELNNFIVKTIKISWTKDSAEYYSYIVEK